MAWGASPTAAAAGGPCKRASTLFSVLPVFWSDRVTRLSLRFYDSRNKSHGLDLSRCSCWYFLTGDGRQMNGENRALAELAIDLEGATMMADNVFDDGKPKASSAQRP